MGDLAEYFSFDTKNIEDKPCNVIQITTPELTYENVKIMQFGMKKFFVTLAPYLKNNSNALDIHALYKIDCKGLGMLKEFAEMNKNNDYPRPYLLRCPEHLEKLLKETIGKNYIFKENI